MSLHDIKTKDPAQLSKSHWRLAPTSAVPVAYQRGQACRRPNVSPGGSKPASYGRFKTSHSEVRGSYQFIHLLQSQNASFRRSLPGLLIPQVPLSNSPEPPNPAERSGAEWSPARSGWIPAHPRAAALSLQLANNFIPKSAFSLFFLRSQRGLQTPQSSVVFLGGFSSLAAV